MVFSVKTEDILNTFTITFHFSFCFDHVSHHTESICSRVATDRETSMKTCEGVEDVDRCRRFFEVVGKRIEKEST